MMLENIDETMYAWTVRIVKLYNGRECTCRDVSWRTGLTLEEAAGYLTAAAKRGDIVAVGRPKSISTYQRYRIRTQEECE